MSTTETTWDAPYAAAGGRRPPRRLLLGMMVAVFLSGGVIGSGATLMIINRRMEENAKPHDPRLVGQKVAAELRETLSLSDEQAAQVDRIMKDHMAAMGRMQREEFFPKIRDAFKQMNDDIAGVLDDDQRVKWNAWLEERRKRVCPPGDHGRTGHKNFRKPGSGTDSRGRGPHPRSDANPESEAKPALEPKTETSNGEKASP